MAKFLKLVNGIPVMTDLPGISDPYDESIYYAAGLAANTNITLPNSGDFADSSSKDILIILNDRVVEVTRDFDVVGAGPTYTQIKFIYDLTTNAVVRFKKNL